MSANQERSANAIRSRERRRIIASPDGRHFEGVWHIKAGDPTPEDTEPQYDMKIVARGDYRFRLYYSVRSNKPRWVELQDLQYMPDTQTLENLSEASTERCITFWNRPLRNRASCCSLFAMRVEKNGHSVPSEDDLPIFEQGTGGSWGAEDEGGG